MSDIKLLPCPFCGGEARTDSCGSHWVRCTVCGARGCVECTRKEAIEQWNTRKPMEHYKLGNCTNDCEHFDNAVTYGYTKAIEDFAERLKPIIDEKIKGWTNSDNLRRWCEDSINKIAEQLKAGGVDIPNKYSRCKDCEYLHKNGNCLKVGGFYSAVDDKDCVKEGGVS